MDHFRPSPQCSIVKQYCFLTKPHGCQRLPDPRVDGAAGKVSMQVLLPDLGNVRQIFTRKSSGVLFGGSSTDFSTRQTARPYLAAADLSRGGAEQFVGTAVSSYPGIS